MDEFVEVSSYLPMCHTRESTECSSLHVPRTVSFTHTSLHRAGNSLLITQTRPQFCNIQINSRINDCTFSRLAFESRNWNIGKTHDTQRPVTSNLVKHATLSVMLKFLMTYPRVVPQLIKNPTMAVCPLILTSLPIEISENVWTHESKFGV